MLHFTIKAGEYFNIGDDIRVVILGGCANNCRVMVDAPREYNIVRGKVLERNAVTPEEQENLGHYYPHPKLPPEAVRRMIAKQHREAGEPGTAGTAAGGRRPAAKAGTEVSGHRTAAEAGTGNSGRKPAEKPAPEAADRVTEGKTGTWN